MEKETKPDDGQMDKEDKLIDIDSSFLKYFESQDHIPEKLFMMLFGKFPNKLLLRGSFSDPLADYFLDTNKIYKDIKKRFPDAQFSWRTRTRIGLGLTEKCKKDKLGMACPYGATDLIVVIKNIGVVMLIEGDYEGTLCYIDDNKEAQRLVRMLTSKKYLIRHEHDVKKKIHLVTYSNGSYGTEEFEVKKYNVDVKKHYNSDFEAANNKIVSFLNEDCLSGLVILNGTKGSGKTTYIRHLINTVDRRFVYVSKEMMSCISDPSFISFLRYIAGSVLVIEDCENLVRARKSGNGSTGISNLLNMCDGLLSDAFNIKIITTFNEDISKIDDALLRKGRLIQQYEFSPLCVEKANKLLSSLKIDYVTDKPMPLCDIFNFNDNTGHKEKKTTIGFK